MPQTGTNRKQEEFTAAASLDRTPRVAVIPSYFKGSDEHDGSRINGLASPQPPDAVLSARHLEELVAVALSHIGKRANTQPRLFGPDEWVLVIADASFAPPLLEALVAFLAQHRLGLRFTVAGRLPLDSLPLDGLKSRFPKRLFDSVDLSRDAVIKTPAPRSRQQFLDVPQTLQQCDRVVSVAALGGAASTLRNYAAFARGPANWLDLARFHPPDLAVAGSLQPNLIVAGTGALSVDAAVAAILGNTPPWFSEAEKLGLGVADTDAIWTRGIEIEEARKLLPR
ncbi:MAG: hypothetical protein IT168_20110 [Bryobacterales bacterium]|nr:hypothetical protein [Bryobacterales bacterium]